MILLPSLLKWGDTAVKIGLLIGAAFTGLFLASAANAQVSGSTPDSISGGAIGQLKAGHVKQAISDFFGTNPLMSGKQNELAMLESQISSAIAIYGPMRACELVETAKRGTLIENRLYLCQHDHFVSRWRLLLMRTADGWVGNNFGFDEKVLLKIDEN